MLLKQPVSRLHLSGGQSGPAMAFRERSGVSLQFSAGLRSYIWLREQTTIYKGAHLVLGKIKSYN